MHIKLDRKDRHLQLKMGSNKETHSHQIYSTVFLRKYSKNWIGKKRG